MAKHQRLRNITTQAVNNGKYWLIAVILFYSISEILIMFFSAKMGEALDIVSDADLYLMKESLLNHAFILGILLCGAVLLYLVYSFFESSYYQNIFRFTRKEFFRNAFAKAIPSFMKNDYAYYQSCLINDMKQVDNNYFKPMLTIIKQCISIAIAMSFLIRYSIPAAFFVLAASFLPILLPNMFMSKLMTKMDTYSASLEKYTLKTNEILSGYEVFKNYNAENKILDAHSNVNGNFTSAKRKAFFYLDFVSNIAVIMSIFITLGVLIFGMFLAINGYLSVGEVFAISFISNGVSGPLCILSENIPKLRGSKSFTEKYALDAEPESDIMLSALLHEICVKDLSVSFDTPILRDVNLTFELGKKYMLVGSSGCGKSTLVKTLLGYFDNYDGEVYYDGIPLKSLNKPSLYKCIAYVSQFSWFFQGTVRENLTLFDENILDSSIFEALKIVELYDKISTLENGLATPLSENASNFSGGEKQRLALARSILKGVNVFILDESTSALDAGTALSIEKSLAKCPLFTVINIAHRLSADVIKNYNEIIVINKGIVAEKGDFKLLMGQNGIFAKLYNIQKETV